MPDTPDLIELDPGDSIWERVYTVSPLVVIGTRNEEEYNLAPKHMGGPMAWSGHFGFVCTPRHRTYRNACDTGTFTVSYPRPDQVTLTGLTATPRTGSAEDKPIVEALPTRPADTVDGLFLENAYFFLECDVHTVIDELDENSLIIGRIIAARAHPDALQHSEESWQEHLPQAPLLAYLHPDRYAVIDESYAFPFPDEFER